MSQWLFFQSSTWHTLKVSDLFIKNNLFLIYSNNFFFFVINLVLAILLIINFNFTATPKGGEAGAKASEAAGKAGAA